MIAVAERESPAHHLEIGNAGSQPVRPGIHHVDRARLMLLHDLLGVSKRLPADQIHVEGIAAFGLKRFREFDRHAINQ